MLLEKDIIKIFCGVDDFCKGFEKDYERNQISDSKINRRRGNLSLSEVVTIMIIYHQSGMLYFKYFYYQFAVGKKGFI